MEPPQYESIIRLGKLGDYQGVLFFGSLRGSGFLRPGTYMKSVPGGSASDLEKASANPFLRLRPGRPSQWMVVRQLEPADSESLLLFRFHILVLS